MKRLLLALSLLALTVPVGAQQYQVNLKLAVAGTAVGFSSASTPTCTSNSCLIQGDGHQQANTAVCVLTASSGTITYRIDGTTVTATEGMEIAAGSTFVIQGNPYLINFSAIRTGSTSGDVRCSLTSAQ